MFYTFSLCKSRDQEYLEFSKTFVNAFVCNAHAIVFLVKQCTQEDA